MLNISSKHISNYKVIKGNKETLQAQNEKFLFEYKLNHKK